jgi:hypothetical protein
MNTSRFSEWGTEHNIPGDQLRLISSREGFGNIGMIMAQSWLNFQKQIWPPVTNVRIEDKSLSKETVSKEWRLGLNHAWALSLKSCRRLEIEV